jgi:hypothetical protein
MRGTRVLSPESGVEEEFSYTHHGNSSYRVAINIELQVNLRVYVRRSRDLSPESQGEEEVPHAHSGNSRER